jgi:peptide deformylase
MLLDIVTYPDKRLKEHSKVVEVFDEKLHAFLDDMYETMIASNGIGLAAIQVARPIRVLIINLVDEDGAQIKDELLEVINPVIKNPMGTIYFQEGCLSVPGFYEDVDRFETLELEYQDRFGALQHLKAEGILSVAIQHEIDHLDGKLFIEKLSYARRKKFEKEYKKLQKEKK